MNSLCLFGGSFDPVHNGHLLVARAAHEELPAERVVFIPAAHSPFKPGRVPAAAERRLQLLRLALAGRPWCQVDDLEIAKGGVSYTIDTVRTYAARNPGIPIYYLIGEDNLPQLGGWREAGELAKRVIFVLIPRPGIIETAAPPGFRIKRLTGFPTAISSSQVRHRVAAGLPVDDLVPGPVAEAIRNNRLYL